MSIQWATRFQQSGINISINGVVVTWVVATNWRAASTRRGFDSPLMQTFFHSLRGILNVVLYYNLFERAT